VKLCTYKTKFIYKNKGNEKSRVFTRKNYILLEEKEVATMALKARQLKLIEALMANPMLPDIKIAEELGINRNTVREWKNKPEFKEELQRRLRAQWEDSERMAVDTMQTLAQGGDFKAAKYILDSLGYAAPVKVEADISTNININIGEEEEMP
jgi:DNA-binding CsgD family transcriptional regulator